MESLENLGPDSNYSGGAAVNPTNETAASSQQQNCAPITGWNFKLGTGIAGVDTGSFGSLSKVSNPYSTVVQTQASVPLLNSAGVATGGNLAGATTIQLTSAQVTAATNHQLWIQGGVPGAPLNGNSTIAFGSLRCAIDNNNGDNVEWIGYPTGTTHVFCYALYVDTTPASGTIRIVKEVSGPTPPLWQFNFGGDISFNNGGVFSLTNSAPSIDFVRQANTDWVITEDSPPLPFTFTGISCDTGTSGTAIYDLPNRKVTAQVAPGQTLTCTYTNTFPQPTVSLATYKVTKGAVGGPFPIVVTGTGLTPGPFNQTATTSAALTPTLATGDSTDGLDPGTYNIAETLPAATGAGSWAHTVNKCVDTTGPIVTPQGASFDVSLANDTVCFIGNTFTPNGKIKVQAMQTGPGNFNPASAESSYIINDPNGASKFQAATNSGFNSFAPAIPATGADVTTNLGFQNYTITGVAPQDTSTGSWAVDSVTCNAGNPVIDASNLFVTLTLSPSDYDVTCSFVYRFVPGAGTLPQVPNKCATPVHSPKKKGTALIIKCLAKTNVGKVKWRVSCKARGKSGRGDVAYCRAKIGKNGKVTITTYGRRITIKLKGSVGASGQYKAWSKTYTWKR